MKSLKILSIFLMLVFVFTSCEKDDFTGDSSQVPTNPTITVDVGTIPTVIDGVKQSHTITVNMDQVQIVDVKININLLDGATATKGEDFDVPSSVMIKAGRTSASFTVSFFPDEDYEETETFSIQIGDDQVANASMASVTADFTIDNFSTDDLKLSLAWNNLTPIYTNGTGVAYGADELADMIFTVYHLEGDSIFAQTDEGSFEALILADTIPDGTYRVSTSFNAINDQGIDSELDFNLNFYQIGLQNTDEAYPTFLSLYTSNSCMGPHNMMDISKVGTTWTWVRYEDPMDEFLGSYGGTDGLELAPDNPLLYPSEVVTTVCGADLYISGLNFGWMVEYWGETVTESVPLLITLNTDNSITIADQYYMTTDWEGDPYPYNIVNVSGTWAAGGVLHIEYELSQDGWLVADYMFANSASDNPYFVADIALGAKNTVTNHNFKKIKR